MSLEHILVNPLVLTCKQKGDFLCELWQMLAIVKRTSLLSQVKIDASERFYEIVHRSKLGLESPTLNLLWVILFLLCLSFK
jgi:hypothetical protein